MLHSGLVAAGYSLLAVSSCDAIAQPDQRTPIVSYLEARGLSLVFVDPAPAVLQPSAVQRSLFLATSADTSTSRPSPDSTVAEHCWSLEGVQVP